MTVRSADGCPGSNPPPSAFLPDGQVTLTVTAVSTAMFVHVPATRS
jgi:hypothetical protein